MVKFEYFLYFVGLFRAAIMESGTALIHVGYLDYPRNYTLQLGKLVDPKFASNNSEELLKLLKNASAEDIVLAAQQVIDI